MVNRLHTLVSFLINKEKGNYVLIGLFVFLAHGLLLFNDGVYWDGWLIYVGKLRDRWDLISGIYADRGGLPIYTAFHWVLYQFPYFIFGYKLVAYLFILFSTFFVYRIAKLLIGSAQISLLITLLALTYPANQAVVELIVIPYQLSYFLFWLGCMLLTLAFRRQGASTIGLRLGAAISLLLSFRMYSLIVYFYGFLFLLFIVWWSKERNASFFQAIKTYIRSYWIFLILPIAFWLVNSWLFPPSGPYVNSDAFILDASIFPVIQSYFTYGLFGQMFASLANLINPIILSFVIGLSLIAAQHFMVGKPAQKSLGSKTTAWVLVLAGAAFFITGFFPYAVVGRKIMLHGWSTRNAILIAVPVAMMLFGLVWGLLLPSKARDKRKAAKIAAFILSVLILLFTVETVKYYLHWQLRAIKDYSVVVNIARQKDILAGTSIFLVYDTFRVGGEVKYRPHEYFGIFAKAIPDGEKIGFDVNYYTYEEYFLTDNEVLNDLLEFWYPALDVHGCQAEMHIQAGSVDMDPSIFFRYFYYRYLAPDGLEAFLATVTDVEFVPLDSDLATNCSR